MSRFAVGTAKATKSVGGLLVASSNAIRVRFYGEAINRFIAIDKVNLYSNVIENEKNPGQTYEHFVVLISLSTVRHYRRRVDDAYITNRTKSPCSHAQSWIWLPHETQKRAPGMIAAPQCEQNLAAGVAGST
jgi:hypothetical protein